MVAVELESKNQEKTKEEKLIQSDDLVFKKILDIDDVIDLYDEDQY